MRAPSGRGTARLAAEIINVCTHYQFHVHLFAASPGESFAVTWEQAAAELERLPRMIFEPDGSFVVTGDDRDGRRWQVDGHLFDFAGRLYRVELHGGCPAAEFDRLLRCIDWPRQQLLFEMVRDARRVDEETFRRLTLAGNARAR